MEDKKLGVILIGHGGLPSDIPKEIVEDFLGRHGLLPNFQNKLGQYLQTKDP